MNRPAEAERAYREATRIAPEWLPAWQELIELLIRQRRIEDAAQEVARLLASPVPRVDACWLEFRVAINAGNPAAAENALREGVKISAGAREDHLAALLRLLTERRGEAAAQSEVFDLLAQLPNPQAAIRRLEALQLLQRRYV